jgi:type II restriction enzyme
MAHKARLRENRYGTIINLTSKQQETALGEAVLETTELLTGKFGYALVHQKKAVLTEIVADLRSQFPDVEFADPFTTSSMSPDGGILSLILKDRGRHLPILITEAKNQGTNDARAEAGLPPQSKGNAIERLGKNVIGFRTMMLSTGIMPFVCFGYGIDFDEGSSILDRVATIAMFGALNTINVTNIGDSGRFNRGSFFFRRAEWSKYEMVAVMLEVGTRATHHYISVYGEEAFMLATPTADQR